MQSTKLFRYERVAQRVHLSSAEEGVVLYTLSGLSPDRIVSVAFYSDMTERAGTNTVVSQTFFPDYDGNALIISVLKSNSGNMELADKGRLIMSASKSHPGGTDISFEMIEDVSGILREMLTDSAGYILLEFIEPLDRGPIPEPS